MLCRVRARWRVSRKRQGEGLSRGMFRGGCFGEVLVEAQIGQPHFTCVRAQLRVRRKKRGEVMSVYCAV